MSMGINTNYNTYYSTETRTKQTEKTAEAATPQTLDDFKKEVYDTINKMQVHPSQSKTQISINISDKAFEKMKNDPDYKDLMLRTIQRDLNGAYPGGCVAPSYSIITIGNDCEYKADAYGSAYGDVFSTKSANSFWEKNTKKAASSYNDSRKKTQSNARYQDILNQASERKIFEQKLQAQKLREEDTEKAVQAEKRDKAIQQQRAITQYENNLFQGWRYINGIYEYCYGKYPL